MTNKTKAKGKAKLTLISEKKLQNRGCILTVRLHEVAFPDERVYRVTKILDWPNSPDLKTTKDSRTYSMNAARLSFRNIVTASKAKGFDEITEAEPEAKPDGTQVPGTTDSVLDEILEDVKPVARKPSSLALNW